MGESHGGNFRLIGRFCAEHKVRVVNLSWGDEPQEFEEWLARSKANQPGEERKQEALELYSIWKQAIVEAIQGCAKYALRRCCWNADSDAGFLEAVPSALELPNLITVGATNQAGDATSFTSHGKTVVVRPPRKASNDLLSWRIDPGEAPLFDPMRPNER
jgi:Subtilase family